MDVELNNNNVMIFLKKNIVLMFGRVSVVLFHYLYEHNCITIKTNHPWLLK